MLYPLSYGRPATAWATSKSIPAAGPGCEIGRPMASVTPTAREARPVAHDEGPRSFDRGPSEAETEGFEPSNGLPRYHLSRVAH